MDNQRPADCYGTTAQFSHQSKSQVLQQNVKQYYYLYTWVAEHESNQNRLMKHRAWLVQNDLPAKWSRPDALEPVMKGLNKHSNYESPKF